MDNMDRFLITDLLPAVIVGQWVSVVEDITNIVIYVLVSVLTKVILNLIESKNELKRQN